MTDGTSWWYFKDRDSAQAAADEISSLGDYLCQFGHIEDDTMAAPVIGLAIYDEPGNVRPWVLALADTEDAGAPDFDSIAKRHGGLYDGHESGWIPIPPELRQTLPFPN